MSEVIQQVQKRMLISLASIAKEIDLQEGDHIAIEVKDGGVFLKPVGWHDKSQEYVWSQEWQERLKSSEKDLQEGKYKTYNDVDKLIADLGVEEDANTNSD